MPIYYNIKNPKMKKLIFITVVSATLLLLSCGQSTEEKQIIVKRNDSIRRVHYIVDSIKQAKIRKQIAKELGRDNRKLREYNTQLTAAKGQLAEIESFHFLRSLSTKEAEMNTENQQIQTIQDSIDVISSRIANNEESVNDAIPMVLDVSGVYEIPVVINDALRISFIFDSGASDVCISPDVASTLIKTGTVTAGDFIGTATYTFADGSRAISRVFIIHKLCIGNHIITNVRATIMESMNAPMLLGQSVQSRFGSIMINNTTHTLRFN
jgi:aspartyl protease family protein